MSHALGLDVGGSTVRAAVVDRASGEIVASARTKLASRDVGTVVAEVARLVATLPPTAGAVGVGLAAMLRDGVVLNAPNLGWRDVPLAKLLGEKLGREVRLVNDLSAAAWGELKAGAARGAADVFTVFVGTGVGSALIVNGALVTGAAQVAGEFGHVKVVPEGGRLCGCGQSGCLEAYAGGAKLSEWMKEEGLPGGASALEGLAQNGDVTARRLFDFVAQQLALAIANQVSVLNPGVLVLGGGVLTRSPLLVSAIRDGISRWSTVASRELRVAMATLGDDSGLVGAALLSDDLTPRKTGT